MQSSLVDREFITKLVASISTPNLHVPQYNFKTRNSVYKVYELITLNKEHLYSKIDLLLFASQVLQSIENEGDPRNLVLVFDLVHFILLNCCQKQGSTQFEQVQISKLVTDIFDILSCYFPINFTPPKDDKFKITPKSLRERLNSCFIATEHPEMVDNMIPFLLDKLNMAD